MGAQVKSAPADVGTSVIPGLTAEKERLMTQRINPQLDHKATCLVFLELARHDLETAKRARDHYVGLSHKYGLSNVDIGKALNLTEARIRAILSGGDE